MNEKPLNKSEFFAKHGKRYASLTAKQRDERYASYLESRQRPKPQRQVLSTTRPHRSDGDQRTSKKPLKTSTNPGLQLMAVMLDPFKTADLDEPPPRVPDGEFKNTTTAWFKDRINVRTNADGRAAFIFRNSPFAATAASSVESVPTTAAYQSDIEYNAYAVNATRIATNDEQMPTWSQNAWSIPAPHVQVVGPTDNAGLQDMPDAAVLQTNGLCWRPVAGGARFKYIDAPLTAKGEVVCGHLPGGIGLPAQCTFAYTLGPDADGDLQDPTNPGTGLNFENAQQLPKAVLNPVIDGATVIWTPEALAAQCEWKSVKPKTTVSNFFSNGYTGIQQLSDTLATGVEVTPPPVNGSQARAEAVLYDLYAHNGQVSAYYPIPSAYGSDQSIMFGPAINTFGSAAAANLSIAQQKQTMMRNLHRYDMHDQDNAIFMLFEGCVPDTLIGVVEVCCGVEWIADTRSLVLGSGAEHGRLTAPAHVQTDSHARVVAAVNALPIAGPTTAGAGSIFNDVQTAVRSGVTLVKDVAHGVAEAAEVVAPLFAMFA